MRKDKATTNKATSATLGEHRIIEILKKRLEMPQMPVPFGDDVSAVNLGEGLVAVLKTDMLVAKTDVPPKMSTWQAARKAIVMNVSDFASKGVQPVAALVALGLPKNLQEPDIEAIAEGLNAGAREYGAYVIGGDTGEAEELVISVSLYGSSQENTLMLRGGAKPGDILAVTGAFGKSAAGLRLLLNERLSVDADLREVLEDSVFMPHARLAEGLTLARSGVVSASIDSSDGLAWSLHELSKMSSIGFVVSFVPMAYEAEKFAAANGLDAIELALYGGEEYELVVTVKPEGFEKAKAAVEAVGGSLVAIGKATSGQGVFLEQDGKRSNIEARGWEHFKSKI